MRRMVRVLMGAWLAACGVETGASDTGGVSRSGGGSCPDGVVVVASDYLSSQVALAGLDGTVQSESLISSASSRTNGLGYPISGDVVLPSTRPSSGSVVLIDRYGTNVVTWLDPETGVVSAQLAVGTGFEANPRDYLEVGQGRAYLSRSGVNGAAGVEPFDQGSDILLLDSEAHTIVGRIEIGSQADLPPRPARLVRAGDQVMVVLERWSLDFAKMGPGQLVGIDPAADRVTWVEELGGLKNCGVPRVSPSGQRMMIACSGQLAPEGSVVNLDESGLVMLDLAALPPTLVARFSASELVGVPLQGDLAFASENQVLIKTQTALGGSGNNALYAFNVVDRATTLLLEARPAADGTGRGWVLGDLRCSPGCSPYCLLADADRGVLQRFDFSDPTAPQLLEPTIVAGQSGLPPRSLGAW